MDAVPLDRAVLGDSQEEAVELLEALGHPRHPPLADPGRLRARSNCSVRALVVLAYELPDGSVQAGQLQGGHGMMMPRGEMPRQDRKSTRLNSSHVAISYAVFCLKKKKKQTVVNT